MLAATETMNCLVLNGTFEREEASFCFGRDVADWESWSLGIGLGFKEIGVSGFLTSFVAMGV